MAAFRKLGAEPAAVGQRLGARFAAARQRPGVAFGLRVALYALILLGLLVVYSSGADPNAGFVYTNF